MGKREQVASNYADSEDALNGELLSVPEAVAWIVFQDLEVARTCRGESPIGLTSIFAIAKAGLRSGTPVMSPKDAEARLIERLAAGDIAASAKKNGGKRAAVKAGEWKPMRLQTENNEWRIEGDDGDTVFRDVLVSADMLVKAFPEAPEPIGEGQAGDAVVPSAVVADDAAPAVAPSVGGSPKPADLQEAVAHLLTQKSSRAPVRAVVLKAIADIGWTAWPNKMGTAIFKDAMSVVPGGEHEKPSRTVFDRVVKELNSLLKLGGSTDKADAS